jgi:hypothetical protein
MGGSVQDAGREYEAGRRTGLRRGATQSSAVQPTARTRRDRILGLPGVGQDPVEHRRRIGACGQDRGALDHLATITVRASQARHESANRLVIHCGTSSGPAEHEHHGRAVQSRGSHSYDGLRRWQRNSGPGWPVTLSDPVLCCKPISLENHRSTPEERVDATGRPSRRTRRLALGRLINWRDRPKPDELGRVGNGLEEATALRAEISVELGGGLRAMEAELADQAPVVGHAAPFRIG